MTRSAFLLLALVWSLAGCGKSAAPAPVETPHVAATAVPPSKNAPSSFLWTVQSQTATVHLFGSVHVASADMYPLEPLIEQLFERSSTLVLEIKLDEESQQHAGMALMQSALLPRGENLWASLDAPTTALLKKKLADLSIPSESVGGFRPWFVSMMVLMQELDRGGFKAELGLDQHFAKKAEGTKEILELESLEQQLRLLAELAPKAQQEDLKKQLQSDSVGELTAIAAEWKEGKTTRLSASLAEMKRDYPAAYEALFTARNARMTEQVQAFLETKKTYFVVVGAGHLVSDDGLVTLLRKAGRTVTQR